MPNVLPRLIRIQFLQTTEVAPARIRVDDGENKMTEAYGYDNMEEQSQELMRRFCNRFYPCMPQAPTSGLGTQGEKRKGSEEPFQFYFLNRLTITGTSGC